MREIPREIAEQEGVPEDLDSTVVGPYAVPSPERRRRAGYVYLAAAALAALAAAAGWGRGLWLAAGALAVIAAYHLVAAWPLTVREGRALEIASRTVEFAVGHASAAVGFTGWRARPVWNVLVFSADEPPTQQGLVRVDALTGEVVEWYAEQVASSPARGEGGGSP